MATVLKSNLEREGEARPFAAHGRALITSAGGATVMRATLEPGWRWSQDVKPIAGTDSCQAHHLAYILTGSVHAVCDDGTEADFGPGDVFDLQPGHDAWVTSDVACEMIEMSPEASTYARGPAAKVAAQEDRYLSLVRKGYAAFNAGDLDTITTLLSHDVVQHVPGTGPLAGDHKGIDSVLAYYGQLVELTAGTFRADLLEVHGDGHGHVTAVHQTTATRNDVTRVSRGSILFTFIGERAVDLLELHADVAGDDAFFA